jgi:hypothetical protein
MKKLRSIDAAAVVRRVALAVGALAFGIAVRTASATAPDAAPDAAPPAAPASSSTASPGAGAGVAPSAPISAPPVKLTVEQVRAAMEEAQKRREALLKPDAALADPAIRKDLLEKWGVEVFGVWTAARGYMIDFHFRVLDVEKALPLFDSKIRPYLVRDGSDIKLPVPVGEKVGAFRTTNRGKNIQAQRDYHIMFGNPDSYVKSGQNVSVVIGDFRVDHLTLR